MIHRDRRPADSAACDELARLLLGAHARLDERDARREALGEPVFHYPALTPTQLLMGATEFRAVS